eukprot:CAMPEP_0171452868 /NCGR_PEP_ID=MMETSP0945-20130129/803_1 /TAXON_ID=109269 /ORGANISM="Vaucheria litorea, Strain CCMP2940" /LENGTH=429 /DNA_ID=CAMNT_0011977619 /DNA_START=115 /DNA_END=1404 /DNA_ORIENTATION=-
MPSEGSFNSMNSLNNHAHNDGLHEVSRLTFGTSIIMLCNIMIGSGILNQGQVFSDAGIIGTTVLYILAFCMIWLGSVALIEAAEALNLKGTQLDFSYLASITHGKKGSNLADGSIVMLNFMANLSYILLISTLASSLLQYWSGNETLILFKPYFLAVVFTIFFIFPGCLARHFTNMPSFAYMGLTCTTLVMLVVFIYGPPDGKKYRAMDETIVMWDWGQMFRKSGSVIFALGFTAASFHVYLGISPRNVKEWKKTLTLGLFFGAAACYSTGIVGYLSFRSATSGNILDNFDGVLAQIATILVIVHLIWYTPMEFVILRHSFFQLCGMEPLKVPFKLHWMVTALLLSLMVFICIVLDGTGVDSGDAFGVILDLSGGIGGAISCFILPAMIYRRAKSDGYLNVPCKILFGFGIFMAVSVPISTVIDFSYGE